MLTPLKSTCLKWMMSASVTSSSKLCVVCVRSC
jgi:hypothetical protein